MQSGRELVEVRTLAGAFQAERVGGDVEGPIASSPVVESNVCNTMPVYSDN